MKSSVTFQMSPYLALNSRYKPRRMVQMSSSVDDDSAVSSSPPVEEREKIGPLTGGNEYAVSKIGVAQKKKKKKKKVEKEATSIVASESLKVLWDDAYGTESVKDYLDRVRDIIRPDGGPPRWFCPVECGHPLNGSPVLLFLPGNAWLLA